MSFKGIVFSINWRLIAPAFLLSCFGLLSIFSSSLSRGDFLNFEKQLAAVVISLVVAIFIGFMDLRFLKANSYLIFSLYILALISLAGLLFLGGYTRGIQGWYRLGPVSVDPEPFTAIVLIIVLSKYFSSRHVEIQMLKPIIFSGIYALAPIALVLLQPDLGSSLSLIVIWLGMVLFSGIRARHLILIAVLFGMIFAFGWSFYLHDYQKQRIIAFLNPEIDAKGVAWSANQSKIAIGNGGLLGQGIGKGSQTQYGFLSEPKTDFIFSAIGEEFGLLGIFILFVLFLALFWQIVSVVFHAHSNFTGLFAFGFAFLLLAQLCINIGMCLGLFPVVGIPLPFVSYSGSFTLAFYIGLGVLMSLERKE
ncbi:MAG: FtsW/RodA/SpoVE family cell cycle protein [Candidatus Pacebacteria bacterium]|nr:FtsW/RodA/SpoVE family cell cycle protein [Candidatus Paceibacterota bacterium]